MLHKISAGRREIGDNSFLRDFRTRMLSSRRAMSRSMILRITSNANGSPAEHEVFKLPLAVVSSGKDNWISDLIFFI